MQLNKQTDYAVRVLMYLASAPESQRSTVAEMAETLDVSANNLAKIVNRFAHMGLVTTVRGRRGGMKINAEALDYPLGELVEAFEPLGELADCEQPTCVIADDCLWRGVLAGSRDAMLKHLNRFRVRDLIENRDRLQQLFDIATKRASS